MNYKVGFPLQNIEIAVPAGTTILTAQITAGLRPDAPCGGRGVCGKCRVEILSEDGERRSVLACETKIDRDMTVFAAESEGHRILTEGTGTAYTLEPAVRALRLRVERPSLRDPSSAWTRVKNAVREAGGIEPRPDAGLADGLEKTLESTDYTPEAVLFRDELLALRKGGRLLAAAADLGTTTVVLYLADLLTGETLAAVSMLNPQTEYGADVISRANYAMEHTPETLAASIRGAVNELLAEALEKAGASAQDVYSLTLAGNTCMHHLFLGIDPESLVLSPYIPSIADPLTLEAADYGIRANPRAKLRLLPCIAGFVGADTAAVMTACGAAQRKGLTLVIDIGTNGELVLCENGRMIACSTAAGPAFEGAKITFGMRGAAGAVDHAEIENGELRLSVIGGGRPRGICGSGLLDLTAALLRAGILDETGRFADPEELPAACAGLAERLQTIDGLRCFVIAAAEESGTGERVYLSQRDIREVQLAKGAMAAGIALLLARLGRQAEDVDRVLIAGAFGSYMSPESACAVGLLPACLLSKIEIIGNAAGAGALMCALSEPCFLEAAETAGRTEFIELAADPDFQDRFVEELTFPEDL